jgi:hypothetical protein
VDFARRRLLLDEMQNREREFRRLAVHPDALGTGGQVF